MASHGCQGSHISDDDGANDEEPAGATWQEP